MTICLACRKAYPKDDETVIVHLGKHAGRNVFICEYCVMLCGEAVEDKHLRKEEK